MKFLTKLLFLLLLLTSCQDVLKEVPPEETTTLQMIKMVDTSSCYNLVELNNTVYLLEDNLVKYKVYNINAEVLLCVFILILIIIIFGFIILNE